VIPNPITHLTDGVVFFGHGTLSVPGCYCVVAISLWHFPGWSSWLLREGHDVGATPRPLLHQRRFHSLAWVLVRKRRAQPSVSSHIISPQFPGSPLSPHKITWLGAPFPCPRLADAEFRKFCCHLRCDEDVPTDCQLQLQLPLSIDAGASLACTATALGKSCEGCHQLFDAREDLRHTDQCGPTLPPSVSVVFPSHRGDRTHCLLLPTLLLPKHVPPATPSRADPFPDPSPQPRPFAHPHPRVCFYRAAVATR
jgi:hypothetical protein